MEKKNTGTKQLALGNEAIARGAIESSVQVVAAYPGTPSSEVVETLIDLQEKYGMYVEWSINEKVAFDVAAGASLVGARSLAAMKGAGLNWTMDTFMTLPLTGTRGGFVIVVADDPGAHYSSNEQDSRFAASWAGILCLEPEHQQDAKEMTKAAFLVSEETELPVMLRSVTRISHSSGIMTLGDIQPPNLEIGFNKHWKKPFRWNVYGPPGVVEKHRWQIEQLKKVQNWVEKSEFNTLTLQKSKLGIIGSGLGAGYVREALLELELSDKISFLKLGTPYPLPLDKLRSLLQNCDKIFVVEEGGPFVEQQLRSLAQNMGLSVNIIGKQFENALLEEIGELTTDSVIQTVAQFADVSPSHEEIDDVSLKLPEISQTAIPRSSTLCAGCPHLGSYYAIKKAIPKGSKVIPIINGDIGCYEQAGYGIQGKMPDVNDQTSRRYRHSSIYTMLDSLYVMGSGISMAQGQEAAGYDDGPIIAVAGDSTFFHATIPALVNAVWNKTKLTFVIMDNSWTAMTGHQPSPMTDTSSKNAKGEILIEEVAKGLGIEFVKVVDSYDIPGLTQVISDALDHDGVSVIISRRECALQLFRKKNVEGRFFVQIENCIGCKECITLGCPAITFSNKKAGIDRLMCVNCGICVKVCPNDAILEELT